jgi:hypothetical protein
VKAVFLFGLFLWQAAAAAPGIPTAEPQYFRYERSVSLPPGAGQSCAIIDAQIFPNAAPSLKDLRLYQTLSGQPAREVPYAITLSEPEQPDSEAARVLNLGMRDHSIVFDLEMPNRPYTDVVLDLAGKDYIATATVSGMTAPDATGTSLGEFTLFDLTTQHLSRSTTIHLQESNFPYLHVELTASAAPGTHGFRVEPQMVRGASVPPSREAQSLFATAAETSSVVQRGRESIATFVLPERVPVERVSFALAPEFKANFSRDVRISDHVQGTPSSAGETLMGTIFRVHLTQGGREIRQQQLSVPATLGSNMQSPANVEVAVENGDDPPLPISAVRLEMRQRKLCFDASGDGTLTVYYGDRALTAPQYDYARLFSPTGSIRTAKLGAEQLNPAYKPRPDSRPITERHPELLWIALLAVVCSLALVAIHSSKKLPR